MVGTSLPGGVLKCVALRMKYPKEGLATATDWCTMLEVMGDVEITFLCKSITFSCSSMIASINLVAFGTVL